MRTERRRLERKRPRDLSYIQFESESGGIVLNATEEGLAFQAATPTVRSGPIALCISPNPQVRISLTAEIAWMNEQQKVGGIRFTSLTAEAREQILAWLAQTPESQPAQGSVAFDFPKIEDAARADANARRQSAESLLFAAPDASGPRPSNPDMASFAPLNGFSSLHFLNGEASREGRLPARRSRIVRGMATGFLIALGIVAVIVLVQDFRSEIGNALIRVGMKLKGDADSPRQVFVPEGQDAIKNNAPSSVEVNSDGKSSQALKDQVPAPVQSNPETSAVEAPRPNDSIEVSPRPKGSSRGSSRSASAQRLWSAIEKGDTSAEVALAQLYVKGDGVRKNCEQARILLQAASKKGNTEAQHQLQELKKSGCR
jgi:hypothetical protein